MDSRNYQTGLGQPQSRPVKDSTGAPTWVDFGVVKHQRTRVTAAQVNAGFTLLPALPGVKWRLVDAAMIAVGGAATGATTVNLAATQSGSAALLMASAVANLTQNALLRAGGTGGTILAGGASFVTNDTNTAITAGKTGSTLATATHIDYLVSYAAEKA